MEQLGLFYPLLAAHGTGQQMTVYNSIVTAPKQADEAKALKNVRYFVGQWSYRCLCRCRSARESLACIRCGAVSQWLSGLQNYWRLHLCGDLFVTIGSVITPFYKGFKEYGHLSFARRCVASAPKVVRIPLTDILLANRRKMVERRYRPCIEKRRNDGLHDSVQTRLSRFFPVLHKKYGSLSVKLFWLGK